MPVPEPQVPEVLNSKVTVETFPELSVKASGRAAPSPVAPLALVATFQYACGCTPTMSLGTRWFGRLGSTLPCGPAPLAPLPQKWMPMLLVDEGVKIVAWTGSLTWQ